MNFINKFFLFETELPENSGFKLFGACHLIWLFSIIIFAICSSYYYMKKNKFIQKKINYYVALFFATISIYRDLILLFTGHFSKGFLPFHLCSMALWIAVIYIWTEQRFWGIVYVLLCVPGAFGALLFPDWNHYPFFNYMHIHDFISHASIVVFGICLIQGGFILPSWKDFWMPILFGIVGCFCISFINKYLATNFWFLEIPSIGSPLISIMNITGERWYKVGFFSLCVIFVGLWQFIINIVTKNSTKFENKRNVVFKKDSI